MAYQNVHLPSADDERIANRGTKPHRGRDCIGAREAERLLGISRAACLRLVRVGQLPAKLVDEFGKRREYRLKLADVMRLRDEGTALRRPSRPPRVRVAWRRLFGPIPEGFTVLPRDGNCANTQPENLALIPLTGTLQAARMRRRRPKSEVVRWTAEMRALLRKDFATCSTEKLAKKFRCSVIAVRAQARRMKIRKSLEYISQLARSRRALPIGTERRPASEKMKGMVMIKICAKGKQTEQWRPKQHVVWEQANGQKVPQGFRVIFKDGNKENFDPGNLELVTREELFAGAMARFLSNPPPLRQAVRLNRQLEREVRRQTDGRPERARAEAHPRASRKGISVRRWTPQMLEILRRDYPTRPFPEVAAAIGVTVSQMRLKASRLGIHRQLGAMVAHAAAAAAVMKQQALHAGSKS